MIFIAGVHGVGKSTLTKRIEKELGIRCYRASDLIETGGNRKMPGNKEIWDIDDNQKVLEQEIHMVVNEQEMSVLEGHFCLLNDKGEIVKIPRGTFDKLYLEMILVLVDDAEVIAKRNWDKSRLLSSAEFIDEFQKQEVAYGKEIAGYLDILFDQIEKHEDGMKKIEEYVKEKARRGINTFSNKT